MTVRNDMLLTPNMKKALEAGSSGLDVVHGHLKDVMYDIEQELAYAQKEEERTEEAMDSMERRYWEGQLDIVSYLYSLTYQLSFAIAEREGK